MIDRIKNKKKNDKRRKKTHLIILILNLDLNRGVIASAGEQTNLLRPSTYARKYLIGQNRVFTLATLMTAEMLYLNKIFWAEMMC